MVKYLIAYATTAAAFLIIDVIWLAWIAKRFYAERLGELLLERPNLGAAAIFYALYVIGIVIFAVAPGWRENSALTLLTYGALFGFFAYATYDMTNYATLKNWPLTVSIVDMFWGSFITAIAATAGYLGTRLVLPD